MFVFEEPFWLSGLLETHGLFGGDGDDSGDDSGSDDDSEDADAGEADDDGDEDSDTDASDSSDDGDDSDDSDKTDIKAIKRENRKLKRDLTDALDLLEEMEDRLNSDDDDDDDDSSSLREENEALKALLNGQYVKAAISAFKNKDGSAKWDWEDPELVFRLLDAEDIEIDLETGEIDGLEEQLEEIAKDRPFLLRKKQKRDPAADGDGSTGRRPGGGSRRGSDKPKTGEDYVKKFGSTYSILTR